MRPSELAEILYGVRGALEALGPRSAQYARDRLKSVDADISMRLRNAGHDPGMCAATADELKLRLISPGGNDRPLEEDVIARCLREAADIDGCQGLEHRSVGRWAEFVNRAVFGGPGGLADEDKHLPVRPWVQARGIDTGDMTALARAFVEWTREADAVFRSVRFS